jgi:hypothetical protein
VICPAILEKLTQHDSPVPSLNSDFFVNYSIEESRWTFPEAIALKESSISQDSINVTQILPMFQLWHQFVLLTQSLFYD